MIRTHHGDSDGYDAPAQVGLPAVEGLDAIPGRTWRDWPAAIARLTATLGTIDRSLRAVERELDHLERGERD